MFNNMSAKCITTLLLLPYIVHKARAAGRIVRDAAIQDHDITPVLGRGYSVATGALQSTCLEFVDTTKPTYDYDYFFTEISSADEQKNSKEWSGNIQASLSYGWAKSHVESTSRKLGETNTQNKMHYIIATMKTERYYSSVDETSSQLSASALSLLEDGQYLSFFQACGPNYIRGIRRVAEVTTIFAYESTGETRNDEFETNLKADISGYGQKASVGAGFVQKTESNSLSSTLTITIKAFGLGLNEGGANSMIARTMDDYKAIMDFSFKSMQTVGVGIVKGIEIVSWVENPQFQVAAKLGDTLQECEEEEEGDRDMAQNPLCTTVSLEMKKMTLSSNAEYVATMNSVMRMNIDKLYNTQHCRSILHGFPSDCKERVLINHQRDGGFISNNERSGSESSMTVQELKKQLDKAVMDKQQVNLKGYMKEFYSPCMAALSDDYGGQKGGTSLVKPWFMLDKCQDVSCTVVGVSIKNGMCTFEEEADDALLNVDKFCMPLLADMV